MPQPIPLLDLQQLRKQEEQASVQLSAWATYLGRRVRKFALEMPWSVLALKSRRLLSSRNVKG
jgi:hypothetical protein